MSVNGLLLTRRCWVDRSFNVSRGLIGIASLSSVMPEQESDEWCFTSGLSLEVSKGTRKFFARSQFETGVVDVTP
ncbi:MAG: hypothetical protein GY880_29990 [Planctomycetaceae bacterium]|nr:hypothetical protein [Planctomycetaceae bacterium]